LASKAKDYNTLLAVDAPVASDRQYVRQRLDVFPILQFLAGPRDQRTGFNGFSLRIIAWITLVATPVLILLQGQVTFLPYQREWIVWLQRITVLVDLSLVWYFWVRLRSDNDPIGWVWSKAKMYLGGAGTLCVVIFSTYLATFPGEWLKTHLPELRYIPWWPHPSEEEGYGWTSLQALLFEGDVDDVSGRPQSVFSNRLVLTDQSFVVDPEKLDKITVSRSFRGRDLRLAVLYGTDLRKADFTGAHLQGASLERVQLQGARLLADALQGARLDSAQLQGARLDGPLLQGASLTEAQLQGASLYRPQLQGARLNGAQLQGAHLEKAQLQGARLDGTQLQGASLREAMVWRAWGRPGMNLTDVSRFDPDTMPWTAESAGSAESTFAAWRDAILETIPPGSNRRVAQLRLSVLDPLPEKEPKDVIKAQLWNEALSAPPHGEEREKQLAAFLADLGCLSEGAPYVARGLIQNGRLRSTGSQVATVADRLYKGKSDPTACPGVKGFTDEDWANLSKLSPDSPMSRKGEEKWR
jgi:uncharacterized protein YjbI with pentapeptide repeats